MSSKPSKPAAKPAKPAPKSTSTAVVPKPSGAVVPFMERLKRAAQADRTQVAKVGVSNGTQLSFRGGVISKDGKSLGNTLPVIILRQQFERAYYAEDFDASKTTPPTCYSYDGEVPHPEAAEPQAITCDGCEWAEWKSDKRGKGKACKEGLRVALLGAAGEVTPETLAGGAIATARFSVLNSKDIKQYTEALMDRYGTTAAVVSVLGCRADPVRQIVNDMTMDRDLSDDELAAVAARMDEADKIITQPYPKMDTPPPAAARTGGTKTRKF